MRYLVATINLYKIQDAKQIEAMESLNENYNRMGTQNLAISTIDESTGDIIESQFEMDLFFGAGIDGKPLTWNWVLNAFGHQNVLNDGAPKAVVLISLQGATYAITFGHSFYRVDQFSDKDWAFEFAKRLKYVNIRTTAITNPNSLRNKTVNTYLEYENLDLGSGEALTKLKAKIEVPPDFNLFSDTIEIGNSIKLTTEQASLELLGNIIIFIESIILNEDEKVKIPYFRAVKQAEEIHRLRGLMIQDIENDLMVIDFSEYQIYATRIVFNDNHEFKLVHNHKSKRCDRISAEVISAFLQENDFNATDDLLDIKVGVWEDGRRKYITSLENLIYYTHEASNALLTDGSWYVYNEDYIQYLNDSISEIPVEYEERYNYSKELHERYLEEAFINERDNEEFRELDDAAIRKKIKQKYYKERYFNNWIVELGDQFANFDRDLDTIGGHRVEVMDLHKGNSMYAVKFGKASGKLCYAIDQSVEAIKAYHRRDVLLESEIENVYLWLVLERGMLPTKEDGSPDISSLNLLILKNKIDQWKKEVRLLGYRPRIKINYAQR
jgi:uncharacterized protein (TIGR04141 family)